MSFGQELEYGVGGPDFCVGLFAISLVFSIPLSREMGF